MLYVNCALNSKNNSNQLNIQLRCAGDTWDGLATRDHPLWASLSM